jgi:hypothetical protein
MKRLTLHLNIRTNILYACFGGRAMRNMAFGEPINGRATERRGEPFMGSPLKETPWTEITPTLEVLAFHGVEREDLARMRSDPKGLGKRVAYTFINSRPEAVQREKRGIAIVASICIAVIGAACYCAYIDDHRSHQDFQAGIQAAAVTADTSKTERAKLEAAMQTVAPQIQFTETPFDPKASPTLEDFRYRLLRANYNASENILKRKPEFAKAVFKGDDASTDTPLGSAVWAARFPEEGIPLMKLLFKYEADPNANKGEELHFALAFGYRDAAKFLLDHGNRVDFRDPADGRTPLHTAIQPGIMNGGCSHADAFSDIVEMIIAKGADVNAKDREGKTPLHEAAAGGNLEIIAQLIAAGADINARDRWGHTPLDVAYGAKQHYCFVADDWRPLCPRSSKAIDALREAGAKRAKELQTQTQADL